MQGISLFVILAIAAVSGQVIVNGKNLAVNGDSSAGLTSGSYNSYLYSVFIPANTLVFNYTVTVTPVTSSDYCYFYTAVKNFGFPCDEFSAPSNGEYVCRTGEELSGAASEGSPMTYTFTRAFSTSADVGDEQVVLPVDNYLFFQTYSSSSSDNCAFTVSTSASTCAPLAGGVATVGAAYSSSSSIYASSILGSEYCVAPTSVPVTGSTFQVVNATGPIVYQVNLPLGTAYVNITYSFTENNTQSSSTYFYVYANAYRPSADNAFCSNYEYTGDVGAYTCGYTPAGPFYVQVVPTLSGFNPFQINYNGNITITPFVCTNGGLGPNCQAPSFDASPLLTGNQVTYSVPAGSDGLIYLDVPSSVIDTNFTLFYQGEASLYISRAFIDYSTSTYDEGYTFYVSSTSTPFGISHLNRFGLNNFFGGFNTTGTNLALANTPLRFYLDFYCSGSTPCPVTLSAQIISVVTTGASGTVSTASASTASASTASASTASASTASASTASASTASASTASASTASVGTTRGTTASAVSTTSTGAASSVGASFAVILAIIAMMF